MFCTLQLQLAESQIKELTARACEDAALIDDLRAKSGEMRSLTGAGSDQRNVEEVEPEAQPSPVSAALEELGNTLKATIENAQMREDELRRLHRQQQV